MGAENLGVKASWHRGFRILVSQTASILGETMKLISGLRFSSIVLFLAASPAQVQPYYAHSAGSPMAHRWDAAHGVLFLGKNLVLRRDGPQLRAYNEDGSQYGADIDLFKDFPEIQYAVVNDFAAGPVGTTVIAAELIYGPRHVRGAILTYDSAGALHSVFDPSPYSAEAITSDDGGNIYLLGERTDRGDGDPPYPLLVKHEPSGRIVGQFLPSDNFKTGSDAIEDFGPGNELVYASLAILNGEMYIYAPSEAQVVIYSMDGKIVRHASLRDVALKIARADKANRAHISEVGFLDASHIVLYLTEYVRPSVPDARACPPDCVEMNSSVYLVDLMTKEFKSILRWEPGTNLNFVGVKEKQLLTVTVGSQQLEFHRHDLF